MKNRIPQAEVLLQMSSTCTHVWTHRKKTGRKSKTDLLLGGRAVNVLHVSLVLSVFFYFLTVRVFISITTALKGYTINSQVPRSPVIHIQPGLACRRFQNRLHCIRWGRFLLWGRLSKLGPEGSRHGVALLSWSSSSGSGHPRVLWCAPGREGQLQTPASQLALQRTCRRPHAWKMIWPLSGSSLLSRARQRPDGLWETLPVSATPSRKPHGSFVL